MSPGAKCGWGRTGAGGRGGCWMLIWGVQDTAFANTGLWHITRHDGHTSTDSSCGSARTTKPLILLLLIGTEEAIACGSGGRQHIWPPLDPLL